MRISPGWVALRYLHDPKAAAAHFAHIPGGRKVRTPSRAQAIGGGAPREAMGQHEQAKGVLRDRRAIRRCLCTASWRGRGSGSEISACAGPPAFSPQEHNVLSNAPEVVRAAQILSTLGERDMLASIYAETLASRTDIAGMAVMGELAGKNGDGTRDAAVIGEYAYARGLPLDYYAYPTVGLPDYQPIAPPVEPAVTYSIARRRVTSTRRSCSSGLRRGPDAGNAGGPASTPPPNTRSPIAATACSRTQSYNMQMGAAELSICSAVTTAPTS